MQGQEAQANLVMVAQVHHSLERNQRQMQKLNLNKLDPQILLTLTK